MAVKNRFMVYIIDIPLVFIEMTVEKVRFE